MKCFEQFRLVRPGNQRSCSPVESIRIHHIESRITPRSRRLQEPGQAFGEKLVKRFFRSTAASENTVFRVQISFDVGERNDRIPDRIRKKKCNRPTQTMPYKMNGSVLICGKRCSTHTRVVFDRVTELVGRRGSTMSDIIHTKNGILLHLRTIPDVIERCTGAPKAM